MKIFYLSYSTIPSRTANSIHVMKMCHAYAELGHDVTLIVPKPDECAETGVPDIHSFYGVKAGFQIRQIPFGDTKAFEFLHHAILMPFSAFKGQPVLVHSRGLSAAWGLTKLFRVPTLFETHSPPPANSRLESLFRQIMRSSHLKGVVLITQALADLIRPFISENVRVIIAPDGVDAEWLSSSLSIKEARANLGLRVNGQRIAVYTGHLYPGRGIDLIIELARKVPDHLFVVVGGETAMIQRYKNQTSELSNLRFEGFRPPREVLLYLQAADVLLMPYSNRIEVSGGGDTSSYASPMKMFEYMAAGRPTLSSDLKVLREVLRDGENALLLPHDDAAAWQSALRRLQSQPSLAETLATQARSEVQKYTWLNRARRLLQECNIS